MSYLLMIQFPPLFSSQCGLFTSFFTIWHDADLIDIVNSLYFYFYDVSYVAVMSYTMLNHSPYSVWCSSKPFSPRLNSTKFVLENLLLSYCSDFTFSPTKCTLGDLCVLRFRHYVREIFLTASASGQK